MLGWFKRRKAKKKEAAALEEQPIQEIEDDASQTEVAINAEDSFQDTAILEAEEVTEPTPPSQEPDLPEDIEGSEEIGLQEPGPVEPEDLLDLEVHESMEESIQVDESPTAEIIIPEKNTDLLEEPEIFDDLDSLGEILNLDEVPTSPKPGILETTEQFEETAPPKPEVTEEKEITFKEQESPELSPPTEEGIYLTGTEPVVESPPLEPPVRDEVVLQSEEAEELEEIQFLQPEEMEPLEEELPSVEEEIIEDIEFLEDVEIYEEPTHDLEAPTEEDTATPEPTDLQETEELFKELLTREESDLPDDQDFVEKLTEVEEEILPSAAKDFVQPAPLTEEEASEKPVPTGDDISIEEPTPQEEPQFLEDVEIYVEPEEGEVAVSPLALQEKPLEPSASSFFKRLADRLSKTRDSFINQMDTLFLGKKEIDADLLDDLEELLITADLGVSTTSDLIEHARRQIKRKELSDPKALKDLFKEKLRSYIMESDAPAELVMPESGPFVIMVIGVNGVGKTTTIGKITHKFIQSGQSVLLVAADTFRAAAVSQLKIWGKRNNVEVVSGKEGVDPSSVAYDAMEIAKEKDYDVVLVDTAGRLHTQANLMEELKKIKRVMGKRLEGAPHEMLLVLDATTGQNGVSQAKLFNEAVGVTGLTLTKLDGTAKGGIVANVCKELKIPIRFIGIGEQVDDLRDFDPDEFIEALFQNRDIT